jgi:hypothetical protein
MRLYLFVLLATVSSGVAEASNKPVRTRAEVESRGREVLARYADIRNRQPMAFWM